YTNLSAGVFVGMFRSNFVFDLYYGKGLAGQPELSSGPVTANNWYHVAVTFNGLSASMYLNGILITNVPITGTNAFGQNFVPDVISPFLIGCGPQYDLGRFPGVLDEVAVYATVLSPGQIFNHYNSASSFSYSALVLSDNPTIYLRLDEPPWTVPNGTTMFGPVLPT